jgi:hypothetical protein
MTILDFRYWHFSDLMLALVDVRKLTSFWAAPRSENDPTETWACQISGVDWV